MNKRLILAVLIVAVFPANAQSRLDFALLSAEITVRTTDAITTSLILSHPHTREVRLPAFVAKNPSLMAAYSGACVVLNFWVMRKLERHHPKWSHALMSIEIGQDGEAVVENLSTMRAIRRRGF